MFLSSLLWPRNIIFVKFRGLCPDAGLRYLFCVALIFTVMTGRTASTTSHLLAAFRFGLPVSYADDTSVGSQKESEKGSHQGQRRGQNRVREGSELDQRRGQNRIRSGQNRIREGDRTGSEGARKDQNASEQDQKVSEQD